MKAYYEPKRVEDVVHFLDNNLTSQTWHDAWKIIVAFLFSISLFFFNVMWENVRWFLEDTKRSEVGHLEKHLDCQTYRILTVSIHASDFNLLLVNWRG